MKLKFGIGNAKLSKQTATFSLPAGYSCPFAKQCRSKFDLATRTIIDGEFTQFRCFSAMQETKDNIRESRWHNYTILKDKTFLEVYDILQDDILQLPSSITKIRIHVSGDFFNEEYFMAWVKVAESNPDLLFYAYTKAIPYWIKHINEIPSNFILTASKGGTHDNLIFEHNLKYAQVILSQTEANKLGLELDHDDELAINPKITKFGLLIHNMQPANSIAAKAWHIIKKTTGGYSRQKRRKYHFTISRIKVEENQYSLT
jgi:hypothetical protein